ncbi:uncharacterized protein BX663DRAFT_484110 [Cokeromyces recurvatus]|uniref:uncharacterized protein n=1 Tax=Cokeromyces recurvatus TaxID=90255 RepID=UPI00221FC9E3|nr:uncharacterized protein BX663DRAFT_484110 [Cokeromyces recurvatus]KAI7905619.1 hypothetical protein BX663DRAFT_484110 [Cokeromyces recurvatus]
MGVQDVVARFNKPKSSTTTATTTTTTVIPKQQKSIFLSSDIKAATHFPPSPESSPKSTMSRSNTLLQKFKLPSSQEPSAVEDSNKLLTPPESPILTLKQKISNFSMKQFDTAATELVDLFQEWMNQHQASEERIKQLEAQVEKYALDATKVRDYEIRVEYLVLKLEQVSEERDYFERQYHATFVKNGPLSPAFSHNENKVTDILDIYEEISDIEDGDDELQIFDEDESAPNDQQRIERERGIQTALMKYITDLEKQKLETKKLQEVIQKQDELISKMEFKNISDNEEMLLIKEQVEIQRIELENKRELLSQLLYEREDLLKKLNRRSSYTPLRKSSMEHMFNRINSQRISNNGSSITGRPTSYSSISSGKGSPPLTAPPKQPLPPLPTTIMS